MNKKKKTADTSFNFSKIPAFLVREYEKSMYFPACPDILHGKTFFQFFITLWSTLWENL